MNAGNAQYSNDQLSPQLRFDNHFDNNENYLQFDTCGLPNGFHPFTTVGGENIVVFSDDGCGKKCDSPRAKYVTVTSESGNMGVVVESDLYQSNGWIHALDTVI